MVVGSALSRSHLARQLGIARSSLYYRPKKLAKDWQLKQQIEEAWQTHRGYGHRRLALALKINRKRIRRVMRKFGLKPYRRRGRKWPKSKRISPSYPNLLLTVIPWGPHHIWVSDFTRLWFQTKWVYVGTVMDVYTRLVVGVSVLTTHTVQLTAQALWSGLLCYPRPIIFHSDNGSEYQAALLRTILLDLGVNISRSRPGSPWENGYQESFFSQFKVELGEPSRFRSLGELVAEIYRLIHYYNTSRIHSALKLPPLVFAQQLLVG